MDCIDKLLQDIHSQRFYNGTLINPTRFFMLGTIFKAGQLYKKYPKREIETAVYRYYVDNPTIASRHPRIEIRNLAKHGISVIKEELKSALDTWTEESTEGVLYSDLTYIHLKIDDADYSADAEYLWMVLEELFKKTYHMEFPTLQPILGEDTDLNVFGQGAYRNHVMEEIQYCVCCDEYDSKRLYAVHILPDELSEDRVSRESISNGLIMCYEHAQEYLHKRFYFNSAGRIENLSSSLVHRNMRLSQRVLSDERISYLRKYEEKMK